MLPLGWEGVLEKLERIAGRLAHAVSESEQSPEEMLESASLIAELASEFEAFQKRTKEAEPVPAVETV
jgi:hypothetical protein